MVETFPRNESVCTLPKVMSLFVYFNAIISSKNCENGYLKVLYQGYEKTQNATPSRDKLWIST